MRSDTLPTASSTGSWSAGELAQQLKHPIFLARPGAARPRCCLLLSGVQQCLHNPVLAAARGQAGRSGGRPSAVVEDRQAPRRRRSAQRRRRMLLKLRLRPASRRRPHRLQVRQRERRRLHRPRRLQLTNRRCMPLGLQARLVHSWRIWEPLTTLAWNRSMLTEGQPLRLPPQLRVVH